MDVDEMMLVYSWSTRQLMLLPADRDQWTYEDRGVVKTDGSKLKPPALTAPKLLNPETCMEEGAKFCQRQRGIVQVRRFRGETVYKKKAGDKKKGDPKFFEDIKMNDRVYQHCIVGPGGVSDFLDRYNGPPETDNGIRVSGAGIQEHLTGKRRKLLEIKVRRAQTQHLLLLLPLTKTRSLTWKRKKSKR